MTGDVFAEAADRIADAARAAEDARRYRALAGAVAEPTFDRALAIGSDVRAAARRGEPAAVVPLLAELRELTERCRAGIAEIRASAVYQDAARAYAAAEPRRVAELASLLFADLALEHPGTLYWSVPILGGRSHEHFLSAVACTDRIADLLHAGIPAASPPPARGADEILLPIVFTTSHEESESPVALALAPGAFPAPACRIVESEVVLYYAERLAADFTVTIAAETDDEWWRVRPAAYQTYVAELRAALTARSIPNAVAEETAP